MSTIFSKIINSEISAYKVAEDENYLAFLDVRPVVRGHVLCIPKIEIDYIFDMDDANYSGLMLFSKKVAKALKQVVDCKKIGVSVVGLEVPHAHVHLIPMNTIADMNFANERVVLSDDDFKLLASAIAEKISL
jgi:histidine triad (HIT) family protein